MKKTIYVTIAAVFSVMLLSSAAGEGKFQKSSYNDPQMDYQMALHKKSLKEIYDSKALDKIHDICFSRLPEKHQKYFSGRKEYKILSYLSNDLFGNNKTDCVFIIFNSRINIIEIFLFDDLNSRFIKLYDDINVKYDDSKCYNQPVSLDYKTGISIIELKDYIIATPAEFVKNYTPCKISDITKDSIFMLSDGCYSFGYNKSKAGGFNSLCFAASYIYNNWDCLKYDKKLNCFLKFYQQEFAD